MTIQSAIKRAAITPNGKIRRKGWDKEFWIYVNRGMTYKDGIHPIFHWYDILETDWEVKQ